MSKQGNGEYPLKFSRTISPPALGIARHTFCHALGCAQVDQFPVNRAVLLPVLGLNCPQSVNQEAALDASKAFLQIDIDHDLPAGWDAGLSRKNHVMGRHVPRRGWSRRDEITCGLANVHPIHARRSFVGFAASAFQP